MGMVCQQRGYLSSLAFTERSQLLVFFTMIYKEHIVRKNVRIAFFKLNDSVKANCPGKNSPLNLTYVLFKIEVFRPSGKTYSIDQFIKKGGLYLMKIYLFKNSHNSPFIFWQTMCRWKTRKFTLSQLYLYYLDNRPNYQTSPHPPLQIN